MLPRLRWTSEPTMGFEPALERRDGAVYATSMDTAATHEFGKLPLDYKTTPPQRHAAAAGAGASPFSCRARRAR